MEIFGKSLPKDLVTIAEIGVNHEGDVRNAINIIKGLAGSGVDAVKLQSYTPSKFIARNDRERLDRVSAFALSLEDHHTLSKLAKTLGMHFISTAVTEDWVEKLASFCSAIKIASGDIDFIPCITAATKTQLPIILSTGASTIEEIDAAVHLIKSNMTSDLVYERLILLHCVSEYPAKIEDANLYSIKFLADRYGVNTGWSNHVFDKLACQTAVAMGATVVEFHVTDQREGRLFRDHALSYEPHEVKTLVKNLKTIKSAIGTYTKQPTLGEIAIKRSMRKGIVYAADLKAGTKLKQELISYARPAKFLFSWEESLAIGKTLKVNVGAGELVNPDHFDDRQ